MSYALLAALVCLFAGLLVTGAWNGLAKANRLNDGTPPGRERVTEAKDRLVYAVLGLVVAVGGQGALWWFVIRE
jgi:hypothetical protein